MYTGTALAGATLAGTALAGAVLAGAVLAGAAPRTPSALCGPPSAGLRVCGTRRRRAEEACAASMTAASHAARLTTTTTQLTPKATGEAFVCTAASIMLAPNQHHPIPA
jgi:hypothetical protein